MEIKDLKDRIKDVVIGQDENIELIITALLAKGHILLEDMPGTGKTVMAKTLAKCIDGVFKRIQFTPDLLPADVTGLSIYDEKAKEFVFHKGPVFTNILLADEINRATPRTQSSLLECMEEYQVTSDGVTRKLDNPFLVIATQNPIETAGTYPLPEAQLDRFLIKLNMKPLEDEEEIKLLQRFENNNPLEQVSSVVSKTIINEWSEKAKEVYVHPEILKYIQQICKATREDRDIILGISPRGLLAFLRFSKAYAFVQERNYVTPDDVKRVASCVLSHRIILSGMEIEKDANANKIESIIQGIKVPTEEWVN